MNPGNLIKLLRIIEELSQATLSEKLGVTRTYLSLVEKGHKQPSLKFLQKAAEVFNIPVALFIIEREGKENEILEDLRGLLSSVLAAKVKTG